MANFLQEALEKATRLRAHVARSVSLRPALTEAPLRAGLLGIEPLSLHGKEIAEKHRIGVRAGSNWLLRRLDNNERILRAFNRSTLTVDKRRHITPAAEWLLDNFYLIEEQIQTARRHLPRHYSRELPRLSTGPSAKLPRVYDLALELISHVDAQIDSQHLKAFVGAYQTVTPLNLGELWAIPIMLRLGLIENLRRITTRLAVNREHRDIADTWADRFQESSEHHDSNLIVVLAEMTKTELPLSSAFVAEFCQRLPRLDPAVHFARNWVEQQLARKGLSIEECIRVESQSQAADQVSVSHTIMSLRFLGTTDWREFVEEMSVVEKTLCLDPSEYYGKMDFATRDAYRHRVEQIARHSKLSEIDVASKALSLAQSQARERGQADRTAHIGYFLIDKGRPRLEDAARVSWPLKAQLERTAKTFPMTFYGGGILTVTLSSVFALGWNFRMSGIHGSALIFLILVLLVCLSQLAVVLMNWLATVTMPACQLPRLDFSDGIQPDCRAMVVVPAMLNNSEGIVGLIERMEIHYLANRDQNLYFALLTDFRDAPNEKMPGDAKLLHEVSDGIEMLNHRYQSDRPDIFFLFHRPRLWNEAEKVWMGYERKRGKLAEFNAALRGRKMDRFSKIIGNLSLLAGVRYAITLDTDTQLPRDTARLLVGTIAHPLNRPQFHPEKGIVDEGYSILQPRVGVSLPSAGRSWFARIYSGDPGIDPYTRAVSDVYQDVFNEGSFIGKGIYDVDAFERALRGRFPENTILSHDLLESAHARSALVSDVELFEEHPSRYNADIKRRHRWIRGDWQIAQWLLPRVPGCDARNIKNPLSGLSQWKIFDNLRRSLVPAALALLLLSGWFLLPEPNTSELIVLTIVVLPGVLSALMELARKPAEWPWFMHLASTGSSALRQLAQVLLTLAFLPYDAFVSMDAVCRTLFRLYVTRQQLLEWQTAGDAEGIASTNVGNFYRTMWVAPVLALLAFAGLLILHPFRLFFAAPFLSVWALAPAIAWWISKPLVQEKAELAESQIAFLRRTARKTWGFFESFVTAEENWLPPDNYQDHPKQVIASRTSPTNMGIALLSNLAAADFGYLPVRGLIERTRNTLGAMERLERHCGHFLNWYDTRTLAPLMPHFVSTVDSGNLAGHLLVLSTGLLDYADRPILSPQAFTGLRDTLGVLRELAPHHPGLAEMDSRLAAAPTNLVDSCALLLALDKETAAVVMEAAIISDEAKGWAASFARDCRAHLEDLLVLAPWLNADSNNGGAGRLAGAINGIPTLRDLAGLISSTEENAAFRVASQRAQDRIRELEELARQARTLANMDFKFLFDDARELFTIGFNVTERRRETGFYDLLPSEARVGSYVAIAQGQIPEKHWFCLGRLLTSFRGEPILISWSGSMFEYLMPLLIMPTYDNTLIDQTYNAVVRAQIEYGKSVGTPWGISESGYSLRDVNLNYQYRAFGVPGLGFKRGLADDLVIAPYASAMALMVAPREGCENMERMARDGFVGAYGFYEAIDYTPSRLPPNEASVTVRSFMAHHQGISFLSFAYLLLDRPMQRRFLLYPPFKAEELLLQERVPKAIAAIRSGDAEHAETRGMISEDRGTMRVFSTPHTASPEVHLLSNGKYHVLITNAGGGYSKWNDLALTRWREDGTCDSWGSFCYIRDLNSAEFWSIGFQPALQLGKRYEAIFTEARAEFRQRHGPIEMHVEISVSPEDDVELRRIKLTNHSSVSRTIELTTYAEVVLAAAASDASHPAFSNLFVQTEFVQAHPAILCTRRARSEGEKPPWLFHLMTMQGAEPGQLSYETDRAKFIGRCRSLNSPVALENSGPLSNTVGAVLDPIVSLRRTVVIPGQGDVVVELVTGAAEQRDTAMRLVEKYHNLRMADRLFDLAWTHSQVVLRQIDAAETDAQLYGRMAGALVYANPSRRADAAVLMDNRRGQSGLWSYGISGDSPIVLLRVGDSQTNLVRRLVQAHAYWRMKGLPVELIIINEDASVYRQSLQDSIIGLIASGTEAQLLDKPGGIFVRRSEQIPAEDRILLQSVARLSFSDEKGSLEEQLQKRPPPEPIIPSLEVTRARGADVSAPPPKRDLVLSNGHGGFASDGREYVIALQPKRAAPAPTKNSLPGIFSPWRSPKQERPGEPSRAEPHTSVVGETNFATPAPWVNVLANPRFGSVISESGGAYTWLDNSHEFRLTPWNNDPVCDGSGEAFYIRDDETGEFWSPFPSPARGNTSYIIRHGFGYSVFEHAENGVASEAWVYVSRDAPVKFTTIKLRNISGRARRLSVFGYWEWVLGELRAKSLLHIQTEIDSASGAVLARNRYNTEFSERVAFVDVSEPERSVSGDRREFIGRNGTLARPAAMNRERLSGKIRAGLDPCAAIQVFLGLDDGESRDLDFRLGAGRDLGEARELIQRFGRPNAGRMALAETQAFWKRTLEAVQVETPDAATNILANGWLVYQTLSARLWGRTGFYQSGGAFGFRDQLQDAMALVHADPAFLREQILCAASRQFREGDVQHWWHPPSGRGVRTHFSDDFLWLPYAVCHYIQCVDDIGILDSPVPFLESRALRPEEESYYDLPNTSGESASLYEHCKRAIENGLRFGARGLPLMGCGDWNDGFNKVGAQGKGESVWLGFFLFDVLKKFSEIANRRSDSAFAERCLSQAETLRQNLDRNAWDGEWYSRAFFDDGEPMGSHLSVECQIDSLPQSWSVLSGAGDSERSRRAMQSAEHRLVRRDRGLIQLFDPPFEKSPLNPGYIKGYPPGVRENGGQYTHAAIWMVMAAAQLGEADSAWELLQMLNPINHSKTPAQVAAYKVEPYVVAADIYAVAPRIGRGGWTWYTGSAGWMYRLVVESLLGLRLERGRLRIQPCMPSSWNNFKVHYRFQDTFYHFTVNRTSSALSHGPIQLIADGETIVDGVILLVNDRRLHNIEVGLFGSAP